MSYCRELYLFYVNSTPHFALVPLRRIDNDIRDAPVQYAAPGILTVTIRRASNGAHFVALQLHAIAAGTPLDWLFCSQRTLCPKETAASQ